MEGVGVLVFIKVKTNYIENKTKTHSAAGLQIIQTDIIIFILLLKFIKKYNTIFLLKE